MNTYNPVKMPTLLDRIRDAYWNSIAARIIVDASMLVAGLASVVAIVAALA